MSSNEQDQIHRDDVCERALNFIESLTAEPLLLPDDVEMTIGDVQEHARIELKSLQSMSSRKLHAEIARLREALEPFAFSGSHMSIERFDEDNQAWVAIDGAGSDRLGFFVRDILRARSALATPTK